MEEIEKTKNEHIKKIQNGEVAEKLGDMKIEAVTKYINEHKLKTNLKSLLFDNGQTTGYFLCSECSTLQINAKGKRNELDF